MKDFSDENRVEFIGLNVIEGLDKSQAEETAARYLGKFARITKHETRLVVHVKTHEDEGPGKRKKFSIHSKLFVPGKFLEASHVEWDFISALQKSLGTLEKEVIKKFKK